MNRLNTMTQRSRPLSPQESIARFTQTMNVLDKVIKSNPVSSEPSKDWSEGAERVENAAVAVDHIGETGRIIGQRIITAVKPTLLKLWDYSDASSLRPNQQPVADSMVVEVLVEPVSICGSAAIFLREGYHAEPPLAEDIPLIADNAKLYDWDQSGGDISDRIPRVSRRHLRVVTSAPGHVVPEGLEDNVLPSSEVDSSVYLRALK